MIITPAAAFRRTTEKGTKGVGQILPNIYTGISHRRKAEAARRMNLLQSLQIEN